MGVDKAAVASRLLAGSLGGYALAQLLPVALVASLAPALPRAELVREAVEILDQRGADFEYDGEMAVDVALNKDLLANYPFCRLSGTANVLVMPGLHSAQISTKLLASVSGSTVLGPLIKGLSKPVQVVPMGATVADMVTLAALTAHQAED